MINCIQNLFCCFNYAENIEEDNFYQNIESDPRYQKIIQQQHAQAKKSDLDTPIEMSPNSSPSQKLRSYQNPSPKASINIKLVYQNNNTPAPPPTSASMPIIYPKNYRGNYNNQNTKPVDPSSLID